MGAPERDDNSSLFFLTVDDNSGCLTRLVVRALRLIYSEDLRSVVSKQLDKPEEIRIAKFAQIFMYLCLKSV